MLGISDYRALPPVVRIAVSVAVGVFAGAALMNLILHLSPYQPPAGESYSSGSQVYIDWIRSLPLQAWYIILGAMLAGSILAGFIAQKLSPRSNFPPPLIAGFCILFYGIVQFLAFYNPEWMTFAACIGCMAFGWLGGRIAGKPRA